MLLNNERLSKELRKLDIAYSQAKGSIVRKKIGKVKIKSTKYWCGICQESILPPNRILRYHVQYDPPIIVMACEKCNAVEIHLRRQSKIKKGQLKKFGLYRYQRVQKVAQASNLIYKAKVKREKKGGHE